MHVVLMYSDVEPGCATPCLLAEEDALLIKTRIYRWWKLSDFIKNILICVLKMDEGLTALEQHEGELLMTQFLGELWKRSKI